MRIGAVIAMESEAQALREYFETERTETVFGKTVLIGKAFGKDVLLIVCGVGKVNAAAGACAALAAGADMIFNFGVAGGLNDRTQVGAVYSIDKAVQYDFDLTQLNGGKIGTLDGETENYFPLAVLSKIELPRRTLASGDRFNDSPTDHELLTAGLHADIRDMEGAAIAQVCRGAGVPLYSVKAISDVYGEGSTTDQYNRNLRIAMNNLKAHLKDIFGELA